jgi:hypothetical protein
MTQGDPVLAGMSNTATDMTEIAWAGGGLNSVLTLSGANGMGLTVTTAANPTAGALGVASNPGGPHSDAVYAISGGRGVYAVGYNGVGVNAYSYTDFGTNSFGVLGGVHGTTTNPNGPGVSGENIANFPGAAGVGVLGTSARNIGVKGVVTAGGFSGVGVAAVGGAGLGVDASGDRAAIRLQPSATVGPPTSKLQIHTMGEMMVDSHGDLFLCKASGRPGTWVKVA